MHSDHWVAVRMIREDLNLTHTTVCDQWIEDEKYLQKNGSKKLFAWPKRYQKGKVPLLFWIDSKMIPYFQKRIITSGRYWIFEHDLETKRQSMECHILTSPRPKKARMSKPKTKFILICIFYSYGIVQNEFVTQYQMVNQHIYREVLEKLWKRVMCMRSNIIVASQQCSLSNNNFNKWVFGQ